MKLGALRDFKITQFSLGPSASIFARSVGFGSRDPSEFVDTSPKCSWPRRPGETPYSD